LNLRPPGYEPDELPDCSTPRCRGGGGWIRTNVGIRQRFYRPPPLASRAPLRSNGRHPDHPSRILLRRDRFVQSFGALEVEPEVGFEPTTPRLQGESSTAELFRHPPCCLAQCDLSTAPTPGQAPGEDRKFTKRGRTGIMDENPPAGFPASPGVCGRRADGPARKGQACGAFGTERMGRWPCLLTDRFPPLTAAIPM
jgi:hypothetical protein